MPTPPYRELTQAQRTAITALDWLYSARDADRRSGRSTVLAIHYLRRMCRGDTDRDGWVSIEDHHDGGHHTRDRLSHEIYALGHDIGLNINRAGPNGFRLRLTGPAIPAALEFLGLGVSHETDDNSEEARTMREISEFFEQHQQQQPIIEQMPRRPRRVRRPRPTPAPEPERPTAWERLAAEDDD